ncbi:MAG: DEAD/DEAH box helicase family protein [Anaerolineae bacterium]|nr:DEAD/DEAH box helicase family protein [Anaerolineae bacterium]
MTPEQEARAQIDPMLAEAGWVVQTRQQMNRLVAPGVAVCEFPLATGEVDYLLFADGRPIGVVEAKPTGTTLSGAEPQAMNYCEGLPDKLRPLAWHDPLPFRYESTGVETYFADDRDPDARSRRIYTFHRPETLIRWAAQSETLRARLRRMPPLATEGLWEAQVEAIRNLEQSFAQDRPRALIQMATGSGKTYTAVQFIYRLVKYAGAQRVLFMVDRTNLGRQAYNEFAQFTTPDDGRKFTELYNVQHMRSNVPDPVAKVCITTVQRLFSMLSAEPEMDPELEERPLGALGHIYGDQPKEVAYNAALPVSYFDFIVIDECHRSIYNVWRQVLEYFDAYLIGLTATPSKLTYGFFNQNCVMEYPRERAVADGVNVDGWVYRIRTEVTEAGSRIEAGEWVDVRDRRTREERAEAMDEELDYGPSQLDRDVVAPDQIRTVMQTFRDRLFTEIYPGRTIVPKTVVFAKDDSHAEDIVRITRDVFGKGDAFCCKITYKTTGRKPEDLINDLRNSYNPRIAVTVDMIATGTDVRPLEVLLFLRRVNSANYFEQMLGRGTRVVQDTELRAVTRDAGRKTHFVIVDAVGAVEHEKVDTGTLERKRSVSLEKLLEQISWGVVSEEACTSLAVRLSRIERELTDEERQAIREASGGKSPRELAHALLDAVDPDLVLADARAQGIADPAPEALAEIRAARMREATAPYNDPALRGLLTNIQQRSEQIVHTALKDRVLESGYSVADTERARQTVEDFRAYVEAHRDEIAALEVLFSQSYRRQALTLEQVKELEDRIALPPNAWTTVSLWQAYAQLEQDKVRGAGAQRVVTDLVSLVRHAVQMDDELVPYPDVVRARYEQWLAAQEADGQQLTDAQRWWLDRIAEAIGLNLNVTPQDLQHGEMGAHGGIVSAQRAFDGRLQVVLAEMNEALGE